MKLLDVSTAIQILKQGGVIAYPTETFYGLGCDATDPKAVQKLFDLKGRDSNVPIPILIGEFSQLPLYVQEIPETAKKLIQKFWPGPLTLIFKAKEVFPDELLAQTGKIAIRISSHPVAQELTKKFALPLTTTSANRSGEPGASNLAQVEKYFQNKIDGVLSVGELSASQGSTILDVTFHPPQLIREGILSLNEIES